MKSGLASDRVIDIESYDVGFSLSPFHLVQILCLTQDERPVRVVSVHAEQYKQILARPPGILFEDISRRHEILRACQAARKPFNFTYATFWNRSALRLEKIAMSFGGHVNVLEDGIGSYYIPRRKLRLRTLILRPICRVLDGTNYCAHIGERDTNLNQITYYSLDPKRSALPDKMRQIPTSRVFPLIERARPHFAHLARYRGMPVYLDINDEQWYPFKWKVAVLRELLPKEPILYLPHPGQQYSLVGHLPQLIDLSGQTHNWNELAAYFIQPSKVFSAYSSCVLMLRNVFGLRFENVLLHEAFYQGTGYRAFNIDPHLHAVLAGKASPYDAVSTLGAHTASPKDSLLTDSQNIARD